jgi:hypothetical protein
VVAASGQWNYFEVRIDVPMCALQISAHSADSLPPDLYVSTTLPQPNSELCAAASPGTCVSSTKVLYEA